MVPIFGEVKKGIRDFVERQTVPAHVDLMKNSTGATFDFPNTVCLPLPVK